MFVTLSFSLLCVFLFFQNNNLWRSPNNEYNSRERKKERSARRKEIREFIKNGLFCGVHCNCMFFIIITNNIILCNWNIRFYVYIPHKYTITHNNVIQSLFIIHMHLLFVFPSYYILQICIHFRICTYLSYFLFISFYLFIFY